MAAHTKSLHATATVHATTRPKHIFKDLHYEYQSVSVLPRYGKYVPQHNSTSRFIKAVLDAQSGSVLPSRTSAKNTLQNTMDHIGRRGILPLSESNANLQMVMVRSTILYTRLVTRSLQYFSPVSDHTKSGCNSLSLHDLGWFMQIRKAACSIAADNGRHFNRRTSLDQCKRDDLAQNHTECLCINKIGSERIKILQYWSCRQSHSAFYSVWMVLQSVWCEIRSKNIDTDAATVLWDDQNSFHLF